MSIRLDSELLAVLRRKTGLSDRQIQRLVSKRGNRDMLSRRAAALSVARDYGVSISRFATPEDLSELVAHRHDALLVALPQHGDQHIVEVHRLSLEDQGFLNPDAGVDEKADQGVQPVLLEG